MKVKIKLSHFRALRLVYTDIKKKHNWFVRGIWLDFSKNRLIAMNRNMLMATMPTYGMAIETMPPEHIYLIPAEAIEQFLKIADKRLDYLTIESDNLINGIITNGMVQVQFKFNKSEIESSADDVIEMDCFSDSGGENFLGQSLSAESLKKASKVASILNKKSPYLSFYPSPSTRHKKAVSIVINKEILMVFLPMIGSDKPPSLNWEQQAA